LEQSELKMRKEDTLHSMLNTALPRLETLWQRATAVNKEDREGLLWETLEELTDALQETQVAIEELLQRTEELETVNLSLAAERRRYRELFDFAPVGYLVTDLEGVIQEANQAAASLLNINSTSYLTGKPLFVFVHQDARRNFQLQLSQLRTGKEVRDWEVQLQPRQSTTILVVCTVTIVQSQGEAVGWRWLLEEIAEHQWALWRYGLAVRGANDGVWDWDLKTNAVYFSSGWKTMLGFKENFGNFVDDWFNLLHPQDRERVQAEIAAHLKGETPQFQSEHRLLHCDYSYRWVHCRGMAMRSALGKAYRMTGLQTDITERKVAEERLRQETLHDGLTGLPNRALLLNRLEQLSAWLERHPDAQFAILFLDLDNFKIINDRFGHATGDQLLIALAQRLKACLRPTDTMARLSGDEFSIVLEEIQDLNEAIGVAERISQELVRPFNLESYEVFTTASIGIALSQTKSVEPVTLLHNADIAMYHAKSRGGNCYAVFDKARALIES